MPVSNLLNFGFYQRLTRRERVLVLLVGGVFFIILNIVALSTLLRSFRDLRQRYAEQKVEWDSARFVLEDQPMWDQRRAWLSKYQSKLTNSSRAGSELLDRVDKLARQHQVTITQPVIVPPLLGQAAARVAPDYQAVVVKIKTSSDWSNLVYFVGALQEKPEDFMVIESSNIQTTSDDPKTLRGDFTIAKWYAPTGK